MKFANSYVRTDAFTCVACGLGTGPTDEVDDDESGIPYPPTGWVRLTIEQLGANPEYIEDNADRDAKIDEQVAILQSQAQEKLTADEKVALRALAAGQIPESDAPPFVVEKVTVALCPAHAIALKDLGVEEESA